MLSKYQLALALALALGIAAPAPAHAPEKIRPLSADRPDATESPYSVPAGMFQIESSAASFTRNDHLGTRTDTWTAAESNLKFGLTHNIDLQLVVIPWVSERQTTSGALTKNDDFGGLEFRTKMNLWGNDNGATAFALLPYVNFPIQTDVDTTNGEWEGGIITPFAWSINDRFSFGMQAELARRYDDDIGHHWSFGHTAVFGLSLTDALGIYIEYAGNVGKLPYESFFSTGATLLLNEDFQLDAGFVAGLNENSDDLTAFTGFTLRF
jgi:hypothetical protein